VNVLSVPKESKADRIKKLHTAKSTWQLQAAKAQFSEVIRRARATGPQVITKQGREEVVILPIEQYKRLTERARQPRSLLEFFAESPLVGAGLDLKRKPDFGRAVDL
jgi:prevent-host-death family protein